MLLPAPPMVAVPEMMPVMPATATGLKPVSVSNDTSAARTPIVETAPTAQVKRSS